MPRDQRDAWLAKLHPLIDQNNSTLEEERFSVQLTGDEFYVEDHIVAGQKVLPGVAYLEMARAAGEIAGERKVKKVKNIVWARPVTVEETPQKVHISLYPNQDVVEYEVITNGGNNQRVVHARGKLVYEDQADSRPETEVIDIEAIKTRCEDKMAGAECYQLFQTKGLAYGPSFQAVQMVAGNETEAISFLKLPINCTQGFHNFVLHPSLMDGALQTVLGLLDNSGANSGGLYLPFALGEVEILRPLPERCYAYAVTAGNQKTSNTQVKRFNILLVDEAGQVLVRIKDFSLRALQQQSAVIDSATKIETDSVMYYRCVWEKSGLDLKTLSKGLSNGLPNGLLSKGVSSRAGITEPYHSNFN